MYRETAKPFKIKGFRRFFAKKKMQFSEETDAKREMYEAVNEIKDAHGEKMEAQNERENIVSF